MSVSAEELALAERVVDKSKREAQVDTGRLKRSINVKVQRGALVFRQVFYGIFEDNAGVHNSTLEENASRMMGNIPYRIELLDDEGNPWKQLTKAPSGRTIRRNKPEPKKESAAKALINKIIEQRKKEDGDKKKKSGEDN